MLLCCAPTEAAVDALAARLACLPTLRTVRVYSRALEAADTIAIPLGDWAANEAEYGAGPPGAGGGEGSASHRRALTIA